MEQLTENRKAAIIELARRGEGGEMENARRILKALGLSWDAQPIDNTGPGYHWQSIDYGIMIEHLGDRAINTFGWVAKVFAVNVLRNALGKHNPIFEHEALESTLYFWGTGKQRDTIENFLYQVLPVAMAGMERAFQRSLNEYANLRMGKGNNPTPPADLQKQEGFTKISE